MSNDARDYTELHKQPGYGVGGAWHRKPIMAVMTEYGCKSVIDLGCGKGRLVELLTAGGFEACGFDPYVEAYSEVPDGCFDAVVSTDVLEHFDFIMLGAMALLMRSLNPKVMYHCISNRLAAAKMPDGSNAHKTVEKPEWWTLWFAQALPEYVQVSCEHNDTQNFTVHVFVRKD